MPAEPQPLSIALVCLHTSPATEPGSGDAGGMNVVVRHQAEALASAGHRVDILTRRSSSGTADDVSLSPGVTLRFLTAGPPAPIAKGAHEALIGAFRNSMVDLGPYDILHSHHWFSGMAALPLARLRGIPHVQSFHSIAASESTPLSAGERPESAGRMAGESMLARESDAIVAVSRAEALTVVERLGGSPHRISVVPPGVDGRLFQPTSSPGATGNGYAVVAGRLQPLKGLDLAIEAIAAMPEALRPELVIAGDASADFDGYLDELSGIASRAGILDRVRFIGPQTRLQLAPLLRDARVILIPSHSETYGLVALEGAASGVPVVAAAAGGLREAVVDGVTGVVLESRAPNDWAAAISAVLSDTALSDRLRLAARQRAEQLTWSRSAGQLLGVYRSLLASDLPSGSGYLETSDSTGGEHPHALI